MSSFMNKLAKREKTILYISFTIISLAVLDRLVISPILDKKKNLEEHITRQEEEIKKNLRIIIQRQRIEAEEKKYATFSPQSRSDEEEVASLLKEIESLASRSSVYIIDLKPSGVQSSAAIKRYSVNLSCEAPMEQLISFMYAVENSSKLLQIAAFNISPKSRQSSVNRCELLVHKIIIP